MNGGRLSALGRAGVAVAFAAFAAVAPAAAQTANTRVLFDRIDRLQNELTTLQRYVYRGEKPRATGAAAAVVTTSPNVAARLQLGITQLEAEIQRLTGQNEETAHRLSQIEERLNKLTTDLEFRLGRLERLAPVIAATSPTGTPATGPVVHLTTRPVLQDIPGAELGVRPLGSVRATATPPAAPPEPKLTPQQQYDKAHTLIIQTRDYAQAERVLRKFIDRNPKHKLLPNAHYWLGRTYFVRNDFEQAAFAFAEGFQRFPKSEKAPANLLNLGMALARLGKTREACTTYSRLLKSYPDTGAAVKRRVSRETARAQC
ncbi:MAG: tol-pal system protein YbgF [Alphaproteobacteria bacterium]